MFGWGYVTDMCVSLFKKEQEDRLCRQYLTECARIITENTAKAVSVLSGGATEAGYITRSFYEIMNPKPSNQRTAEDIINGIIDGLEKIRGEEN